MALHVQIMAVTPAGDPAEYCASEAVRVEISTVLGEAGLKPERFTEWTLRYGADSLGKSPHGEWLLPGFPALSMVAWVDVDPLIMPNERVTEFVKECEVLLERTSSSTVSSECERMRKLAECAVVHGLLLRFDGT